MTNVITARRDSVCFACKGPISVGDELVSHQSRTVTRAAGFVHLRCRAELGRQVWEEWMFCMGQTSTWTRCKIKVPVPVQYCHIHKASR